MDIQRFRITRAYPPSERIKNARIEISYRTRLISHILTVMAREVKAAERGKVSLDSLIQEGQSLILQHSTIIFAELGEVRKAVMENRAAQKKPRERDE